MRFIDHRHLILEAPGPLWWGLCGCGYKTALLASTDEVTRVLTVHALDGQQSLPL